MDFANYYDKDVTAIQLYDDIIGYVMLLRAKGNAVPSNGMSSQFHVLHIGYFSPSDFQLQAMRDHGKEKS